MSTFPVNPRGPMSRFWGLRCVAQVLMRAYAPPKLTNHPLCKRDELASVVNAAGVYRIRPEQ